MYEHRTERLLPWSAFLRRAFRHVAGGFGIVAGAAAIGTLGYHSLNHLPWLDAFLNASMILSGMGPVDRMVSDSAKLFAALYALFSGLVVLAVMGVVLAPWVHRLMHHIHHQSGEAVSGARSRNDAK